MESLQHQRFNHLCTMWQAAPLSNDELEELKLLAKKFKPAMLKWIEEHPDAC